MTLLPERPEPSRQSSYINLMQFCINHNLLYYYKLSIFSRKKKKKKLRCYSQCRNMLLYIIMFDIT